MIFANITTTLQIEEITEADIYEMDPTTMQLFLLTKNLFISINNKL